jgi:hypothetical protein
MLKAGLEGIRRLKEGECDCRRKTLAFSVTISWRFVFYSRQIVRSIEI